jgi:hypothetical protein
MTIFNKKKCSAMRTVKNIFQSLILALVNLLSVFLGFIVYHFSRGFAQVIVQVPAAAVFSILLFSLWIFFLYKKNSPVLPASRVDFITVFVMSLVWIPAIFYPIHYLTQHYISSFGNIYWMWLFQMPVNAVILFLSYVISCRRPADK